MTSPPDVVGTNSCRACRLGPMETMGTFRRDGVIAVRGVLDEAQLQQLAVAVDQNLAAPGPWANDYTPEGGTGRFFGDYVNWERIRRVPTGRALRPTSGVGAEPARRDTRFFHEHTLVKEPDTHEVTPWHHDEPYYCIDGATNVSLWVPLDPVPRAAGVEFIVGSHLWGRRFVPRKFVDQSAYTTEASAFELVPDIDAMRDQHEIVSFDMEPGDVIAFHYRTLHSTPGTAGAQPPAPGGQLPLSRQRRPVRHQAVAALAAVRTGSPRASRSTMPRFPLVTV